ncbi:anti-phage defense-associated sirtuin Dsr1 [Thalassotalea aquiviva]|uniref:anti-phage defense-associated sirtuin Dsr1 n=1 Tax=Thalassotalea aquiviva TaxID=3242415 RepID=UPI00352AFB47
MQFVKNGPDVPEALIQAHEEGNVVFFCGAGISFPAGLPGFGGLVWELYKLMGITPDEVQQQALKAGQFDTAVSLLEAVKQTNEWRRDVRHKMAALLEPDFSKANATSTHRALLQLSLTKNQKMRLITTNFDRVFFKASEEEKLELPIFKAPLLPVPKNRWDGLVYLHGLLPDSVNGSELDHLVVSSGDFGLAYLTERWAARFVSELFRSYTVCFVGYSLNDPVLRYMMDALAADRLLGESPPEMFAFGEYSKGKFDDEFKRWKAKNVTPILYKSHKNHYYLHRTLINWSSTYKDGLSGKEQIVATTAPFTPTSSDYYNEYARRLAWALSHPSGIPANTFSKLIPSPPLSWLSVLDSIEFKNQELSRFGVYDASINSDATFSLFSRPAKCSKAPLMTLSQSPYSETQWDNIMRGLGNWLVCHLNNPDLVLFVLKRGGILNSYLQSLIEQKISEQRKQKQNVNSAFFEKLKLISEDAVLSEEMLTVWDLVLAGYCINSGHRHNLYSWADEYQKTGITPTLKSRLRKALSPVVIFRKPIGLAFYDEKAGIRKYLSWDIDLSSSFAHSAIKHISRVDTWKSDVSRIFSDVNALLIEVMELKAVLGGVDEHTDYTYVEQPSISEHPQNKDYNNWTVLIDLVRDSWISLLDSNASKAKNIVRIWWETPFPIFKRLAFFATSKLDAISPEEINNWLEQEDSKWLWSVSSQRELLQLLPHLAGHFDVKNAERLLNNICSGPNRIWYREDLTDEAFGHLVNREKWLRLEKLKLGGLIFSKKAEQVYQNIKQENPNWELADDQREEFPFWMGEGSYYKETSPSPTGETELIAWLKSKPDHDHWDEDDWSIRCKNDFMVAKNALLALEQDNIWIPERWREALNIWTESKRLSIKAWRSLSNVFLEMDEHKLKDIAWNLSRWLKANTTCRALPEQQYFSFVDKLLAIPYDFDNEPNDVITSAINHPIGITAESLFRHWYADKPNDNDGLDDKYRKRFELLVSNENEVYSLAKVIVATNALSLYRVSPGWTQKHVLPLFDWGNSNSASLVWRSYLWSPRLHESFLIKIKTNLLYTANYYEQLGQAKEQYARFLTYVALQQYEDFKVTELANAFRNLPIESLRYVVSSLNDALSNSGDRHNEYWEHRVKVFLNKIWPKDITPSEQTVSQLALLCINAKEFFVYTLKLLKHYLTRIDDTEYIVNKLKSSEIIRLFPKESLDFLDMLITDEPRFRPPSKLRDCLDEVLEQDPDLHTEQAYQRLNNLLRRYD